MSVNHYKRAFLNKPKFESSGHIIFRVKHRNDSPYMDTDFTIGDCTRQINLNFGYNNAKDVENSLYKLDLLIREITKFKEAYCKALEEMGKL